MNRLLVLALLGLVGGFACGKTGVFQRERFACVTSGDCADGFACVAGECRPDKASDGGSGGGGGDDAGEADDAGSSADAGSGGDAGTADAGVSCASSAECLAGLSCVDGVCCRSSCSGPCDTCDQAGFEGTCLPSPAGTSPSACSGYTCDGQQASCPSACAPDAGFAACSPTYVCAGGSCTRCWSSVKNDFSLPGDPSWTLTPTSLVNIANGRLSVSVSSHMTQNRRSAALADAALPVSGCGVTFELLTPAGSARGYVGGMELSPSTGSGLRFGWRFADGGVLAAWARSDGGTGEQLLYPEGGPFPRWLRVEESDGELRWRTTSTTSFTTVHSVTHDEVLPPAYRLEFFGSLPPPNGTTVTFEVDDLNRGP